VPQDFRISVAFTSDWHIGTGAGRPGSIDRLVRRDPVDRLPYVPAKTFTGVLRDSCEAIADGLDKADGGTGRAWMALLDHIFGDQPARARRAAENAPASASLSIGPAHIVDSLLTSLRAKPALKRALTFVKPGVRIDPGTGQAQTKHLRMIEVVRGGVTLVSEATLDLTRLPNEWHEPARALLWAGARSVGRVGGQRRRGLGRCNVTLGPTRRPSPKTS
jgi:CRISPR-associated protein Csx10